MSTFVNVANANEVASGQAKQIEVRDKTIALFNVNGTFYAIDDTCPHRGGPLSDGEISGDKVTCPWHGAIFNLKTGEVLGPPAPTGVACYNVRVVNGNVEVEV